MIDNIFYTPVMKTILSRMTSENDGIGRRTLGYLLLGYLIIAPVTVYGVLAELGSFASGESVSAFGSSVLILFSMIGSVTVIYSQIRYLDETGWLRRLDRKVAGASLKRVLALVSFIVLALVYINAVLANYDFYQVDDPELGPIVILTITLALIAVGILIFNIMFVLIGPMYILLFYFSVVRG